MEFETNMEQMADQQDAFLEGWEPADQQETEEAETDTVETEVETDEADEKAVVEQAEDTTEANTETTAETENTAEQTEETPAETTATEESWIVNYMGQQQTLTKADITPELLQKGKDYDRIRSKYDEAKPVMELFTAFAAKANMSVMDYAKHLRAEAKRAEGLSEAEAARAIDIEDREAAVAAAEAAQRSEQQQKESEKEKIRADFELFGKLYPEVYEQAKGNPSVIPKSVWDAVNNGDSLAVAYKKYADAQAAAELQQAKAQAAAAVQNAKNVGRSTGSMKSAGSDTKNTDAFMEGWGE